MKKYTLMREFTYGDDFSFFTEITIAGLGCQVIGILDTYQEAKEEYDDANTDGDMFIAECKVNNGIVEAYHQGTEELITRASRIDPNGDYAEMMKW